MYIYTHKYHPPPICMQTSNMKSLNSRKKKKNKIKMTTLPQTLPQTFHEYFSTAQVLYDHKVFNDPRYPKSYYHRYQQRRQQQRLQPQPKHRNRNRHLLPPYNQPQQVRVLNYQRTIIQTTQK